MCRGGELISGHSVNMKGVAYLVCCRGRLRKN